MQILHEVKRAKSTAHVGGFSAEYTSGLDYGKSIRATRAPLTHLKHAKIDSRRHESTVLKHTPPVNDPREQKQGSVAHMRDEDSCGGGGDALDGMKAAGEPNGQTVVNGDIGVHVHVGGQVGHHIG